MPEPPEEINNPDPHSGTQPARKSAYGEPRTPDGPSWTQCRPDCIAPRGRQAHCPVDHRTFTTVANFDKHRRHGRCIDPATLGMTTTERGLWLTPATDEYRERMGWAR